VLYRSCEAPEEAGSFGVLNGVPLRVDPSHRARVVGSTVLDLRRRILEEPGFQVP
jgi:hypothetical protein